METITTLQPYSDIYNLHQYPCIGARRQLWIEKVRTIVSHHTPYGITKHVSLPYAEAVAATRAALADEGFGVLTEIDVRETFKKKLDADFRPYIILGACNPPLAHQALSEETDIGLLLPCNVVVYQGENVDESVVSAIDPVVQLGVSGKDEIAPLAEEVKSRLLRVLEAITG